MDPAEWLHEVRDLIESREPEAVAEMRFRWDEMAHWLDRGGSPPVWPRQQESSTS